MKLNKYFMALFAFTALTVGCSQNDNPASGEDNNNGVETNYITINIAGQKSRATVYEDGTEEESAIEKVRFYFFDANKNMATVKNGAQGGYTSHLDWTTTGASVDPANDNVEASTAATLIIQTKDGDKLPAYVMAVVNPQNAPETNRTFGEMEQVMRQNSQFTTTFPMTNAVYAANGETQALARCASHLHRTEEAAVANPLTIYVERAVAKVGVFNTVPDADKIVLNTGDNTNELIDIDETSEDAHNIPLYLDLTAWNLTTVADKSYIVKHINPMWTDALFGTELWNHASAFRSYWAYNDGEVGYLYKTYAEVESGVTIFDLDEDNRMYCEENAAPGTSGVSPVDGERTQIVVAGRITDKMGTPLTIVEVMGQRMLADIHTVADGVVTVDAAEKDLHNNFWNWFLTSSVVQTDIKLDGVSLTRDQVKLVSHHDLYHTGGGTVVHDNHYATYVQLESGLTGTFTYKGETKSEADVNKVLVEVFGKMLFYNGGRTYYYEDIRHLGNTADGPGYYGVVRNHYYGMNINGVTGLGTPVFDETEPFIPEVPESLETYLAAKINVLAWRFVSWDVTLGD